MEDNTRVKKVYIPPKPTYGLQINARVNGKEILDFVRTDVSGAWYTTVLDNGELMELWLCDVVLYVFGHFPESIYIKVIEE